jgi:hypothetical protein
MVKAMARTLIETPFPSTAEVARKMGVSRSRVRLLEQMLFPEPATGHSGARKKATRGARQSSGKVERARS